MPDHNLSGTIILEHGTPANALTLRVYQREFGGVKSRLAEVRTGADGRFTAAFVAPPEASVEVYAVGSDGEIRLSNAMSPPAGDGAVNLVAPSWMQPARPEFERLTAAMAPMVGTDAAKLGAAVERGDRRDISLLAAGSKWDARAIALASAAHQQAATTGIPAEALYALYRSGLPSDPARLARVGRESVKAALMSGASAGLIGFDAVEKGMAAFTAFSTRQYLEVPAPGKLSSLRELVERAELPAAEREAFVSALGAREPATLWTRAAQAGVSSENIDRLRLQGQLAYLTLNHAELSERLQAKLGASSDPRRLIQLGFGRAEAWVAELDSMVGGEAGSAAAIPPAITGSRAERIQKYSEELARRVRRMDPRQVTRQLLDGDFFSSLPEAERAHLRLFLDNAGARGFVLGQTPLGPLLREHGVEALLPGLTVGERATALEEVKAFGRIYSITSSDDALKLLMSRGFRSARDIARYSLEEFRRILAAEPALARESEHVYWKAHAQASVSFSVFSTVAGRQATVHTHATSGDASQRAPALEAARVEVLERFPTLESLFDNVDFCACEACQSALSPAAYFMDLMRSIDPSPYEWVTQKANWSRARGPDSPDYESVYVKPYDALLKRRPDLPRIPPTCDNTNTLLPVIDIVIDVLEQRVLGDATDSMGFDTTGADSADLIAEPRNIAWDVYDGAGGRAGLRSLPYPMGLPFDLSLEMARAFLQQLGVPLGQLREQVGRPRQLEGGAGAADGLLDVWLEALSLSPAEAGLLLGADRWHELYGYASAAAALQELRNAQTLARRLGITYVDLVELCKTGFINPALEKLQALADVGLDADDVERYLHPTSEHSLTTEQRLQLEARLAGAGITPEGLSTAWEEVRHGRVLLLRSPDSSCDFSRTRLEFAQEPSEPAAAFGLVCLQLNVMVRLRSKLGWSFEQLDAALCVFTRPRVVDLTLSNWSAVMRTSLIYCAHFVEIARRTERRVPMEELLTFWAPLSTAGALFERLFPSHGSLGANDPIRALARQPEGAGLELRSVAPALRQAFQVSNEELLELLDALGLGAAQLTQENVSQLMRHVALARATELGVADLITHLALAPSSPFGELSAAPLTQDTLERDLPLQGTLGFLSTLELLREVRVGARTLESLCRHRGPGADATALRALTETLRKALASLPRGGAAGSAEQRARVEADVLQLLATELRAPLALVTKLVTELLRDPASNDALLGVFVELPISDAPASPSLEDYTHLEAAVARLRKALDVVLPLGLSLVDVAHLVARRGAGALSRLPLTAVTDTAAARANFAELLPWFELAAARRNYPDGDRVVAVLEAARRTSSTQLRTLLDDQLDQAIASLTSWSPAFVREGRAALGFVATSSAPGEAAFYDVPSLASARQLRDLTVALEAIARVGSSAERVVQWAKQPVTARVASELRAALKSRHDAAAWRGVAQPIFDRLRRQRRDALVAHLTHLPEAPFGQTREELYEYLLLDPGTEPAVLASCLQTATSSVQSFVQRVLMNRVEEVHPRILDAARFEWMRNYRVWEVNRKFFLWPENFLNDFRDDKTHLFRDLEGALAQGPMDEERVGVLLSDYLLGLEGISRLEMVTMHYAPGASAAGGTVHVIGRTTQAPYRYFHRTCQQRVWAPWNPLGIEIEAHHFVLTPWQGRLCLFWVTFLEKPEESDVQTDQGAAASVEQMSKQAPSRLKAGVRVQLQLHWVEHLNGAWANRSASPEFVDAVNFRNKGAADAEQRSQYFVHARVVAGSSAEPDDDALQIVISHASGGAHCFTLRSRLSPPKLESSNLTPSAGPLRGAGKLAALASKWQGAAPLSVELSIQSTRQAGMAMAKDAAKFSILRKGSSDGFRVLLPSSELIFDPRLAVPRAAGDPSVYVFEPQAAQHVVFRGIDGDVHDLWGTENGWFYTNLAEDARAKPASDDPHGYALPERYLHCIVYAAGEELVELCWQRADAFDPSASDRLASGWSASTLYRATGGDTPVGRPAGGVFAPRRGALFRTQAGRILAVMEDDSGAWRTIDLSGNGWPKPASDLCGVVVNDDEVNTVSRHVYYRSADGRLHQLRGDAAGTSWVHSDLTTVAGAPLAAPDAHPMACPFVLGMPRIHVIYRDPAGILQVLDGFPRIADGWNCFALDSVGKAATDPREQAPRAPLRIVYGGTDGAVHELRWELQKGWTESVLSLPKAAPFLEGAPVPYTLDAKGIQPIVYRSRQGLLCRSFRRSDGLIDAAPYELVHSEFNEAVGALIAPFFYEDLTDSRTFFVEPALEETTVHDWQEYGSSPEDSKSSEPELPLVAPTFPDQVAVAISPEAVLRAVPSADRLLTDAVLLRTEKGIFDRRGSARAELPRPSAPGAAGRQRELVDATRGTVLTGEIAGITRSRQETP